MNMRLYLFLLGRIALLNAVVLGLPLCCALYWGEDTVQAFAIPMAVTLVLGLLLQNAGKQHKKQLGVAEGAWYLVSVWFLLGLIGMMPYVLTGILTPADAFFESISAYTTTGVSCLAPGQAEASSLLFWHSLMEWMGGLNFIIMLVTVVPQVSGCFGVTLSAHQSIAFSPMVSRMHNAALQTGKIYVGITLISAALYIAAGLNVFEAVNQAMTTASTSGGTASLDFAGYDNLFLEVAAMISMILASCNFLLIWRAVSRRELRSIFSDTELRTFLAILGAVSVMIVFHLWHSGVYDIWQSLRYGTFAVVSFLSTTGFASAQLSLWPGFDRYVLFLLVFAGGCIGYRRTSHHAHHRPVPHGSKGNAAHTPSSDGCQPENRRCSCFHENHQPGPELFLPVHRSILLFHAGYFTVRHSAAAGHGRGCRVSLQCGIDSRTLWPDFLCSASGVD
jgi:trk system potassium uptake protein TrkH